jgi:O-antigen/teichoic acid export membrane protein/SAM-dependent methyltransferase
MASQTLARGWFPEAHLSQAVIGQTIALMGVVCSFQWLIGFYQAGLIGLQRQVALNVVRSTMAVVNTGGAVLVLTTVSPTITAFFLWLMCASFLQLASYAILFWKCMPRSGQRPRVVPRLIRGVWRFAAGMAGLAACGVLLMQADKLVVSRLLPLATFGTYSLAALVASGLLVIISPLFNTMFPQFSALVASGDEARLRNFYHSCAQTAAVLVLSAGCVVAFFSRELLFVWTGNVETTRAAAPIVTLLVIGTALNGLMSVPYALQLAHGWTRLGLTIAASELLVVGPLLVVLTKTYGVLGAAAVWPLLNAVYVAVAIPLTHRRILRQQASVWLLHDVLPPLMAAFVIAASARVVGCGAPRGRIGRHSRRSRRRGSEGACVDPAPHHGTANRVSGNVLLSSSQIDEARNELDARGLSSISSQSLPMRLFSRLGLFRGIAVGDRRKSWDVLKTASFLEERFPKATSHILDIGAFASEIPPLLHRLGYRHLTAIDLNPHLTRMPHADSVRYVVSDFLSTPLEDGSVDAITSISVIEHGFQPERLLAEAARLLRPGGCFIASFDYWPEKIATEDVTLFGMSWRLFSREEVLEFVHRAAQFGFTPMGDLDLDAGDRVIHWGGFDYTFAWLALEKGIGSPKK